MLNQLTMDKENVPLALDDTHKATRDLENQCTKWAM
jgi:hypothetical protein